MSSLETDRLALDLVEIGRFERFYSHASRAQLLTVFSEQELSYTLRRRHPVRSLAGRFAVKEAIIKLLEDLDVYSMALTSIEVVAEPSSRPKVALSGEPARLARALGFSNISISLSHTRNFAVGGAIASTSSSDVQGVRG